MPSISVSPAKFNVCNIPLKQAWDLAERLPATLGVGVAAGEARRWKRLIEAEGAIVELR